MYKTILITLENSAYDRAILDHIEPLARLCESQLIFIHVADGWAARNFQKLSLQESEEIKADREYLATIEVEFRTKGFNATSQLAMGEPSDEIIKFVAEKKIDLIAMATHGHGFVADVIHGSVADEVRHAVEVPVLMLRVPKPAPKLAPEGGG